MNYIAKEGILPILEKLREEWKGTFTVQGIEMAMLIIEDAIAADVAPTKRGVWRKMYRQYQCSSCGAHIDANEDAYLYGMIEFGERKPYCYYCGSLNDFERKE